MGSIRWLRFCLLTFQRADRRFLRSLFEKALPTASDVVWILTKESNTVFDRLPPLYNSEHSVRYNPFTFVVRFVPFRRFNPSSHICDPEPINQALAMKRISRNL